jgi:hypothetical protein
MKKQELDLVMELVGKKIRGLRDAGQKEYSRDEADSFANFERVGARCRCSNCGQPIGKEIAAMVYLEKHIDGIHAHVSGHKSQRENVTGRIEDAIVYLNILWGMVAENEGWKIDEINADYDREHAQTGKRKRKSKASEEEETKEVTTSQQVNS